jgi:hypothetical protein
MPLATFLVAGNIAVSRRSPIQRYEIVIAVTIVRVPAPVKVRLRCVPWLGPLSASANGAIMRLYTVLLQRLEVS